MKLVRVAGFVLLLTLFLPLLAVAQNSVSTGSISGRVTDNSGGVVQGATVTATEVATGLQLTRTTNDAGLYTLSALKVGNYKLSFSQTGFKTTDVRDVIVHVGQNTAADVALQVGALTESVTVSAETPLLRTTESSVSTVVNQELIEDLPLSGRRYTDFVLLTPNVNTDGDFGLVTVGGQQGGADSGYANGNGSNSFTLDGANATSNFFGDARGRTRVPYVFGEQSIQEFQVADSPYNAAYGGAATGFVNTVTKSGTDVFHGDAFYYNRNSGTGADDAIDHANGVATPLNVLQQFGADLGGPITRHSAWFYFDYEQQRQLQPISVINSGYSGLSETNFQNVAAGTPLPPPNGPFPIPGSFGTAPLPGDPNYATYLQQVSNALNAIQSNLGQRARRRDDLSFFPKLDWQAGKNDHLTFLYNYNRFNSPGGTITFNPVPSFGIEALPNNFVRDHHATAHWTHTFAGNLLNDLHVSFLRDEQIGTPSGIVDPTLPSVALIINGFFDLGNPTFSKLDTKEFQWEIGESLNYVRGRHDLKLGFDFNRTHVTDFNPGNFLGSYTFFASNGPTDFTNFALGHYNFFTQSAGNPVFSFTVPYYGFYVQDKFQLRHNITLDLGLREDFQVYPQPRANPAFPPTGQFPNQYQRLSPRVGFAYQPFAKTVVRGGFGLFHEVFNGINYESSTIANGLASSQATAFVPFNSALPPDMQTVNFPNALTGTSLFNAGSNISLVSPGFRTPYIIESSLEIQRELFANTTLTVGTLWTRGVHLISSTAQDLNLMLPTGSTSYTVCPGGFDSTNNACLGAPGATFAGPNLDAGRLMDGLLTPQFGQINALISPGNNHYNSLYVQVQRRAARGLQLLTSYTLSKDLQSNGVDFNNQFDFHNTRGPSLLDQRHRLSVAAAYSPDASNLSSDFARVLLNHWTLSTVMQFNSGRPYTAILGFAGNSVNNSAVNESTGNTSSGINGGNAPSPTQGYNTFYGPWVDEIDTGIERGFHLTERQVLTFKVQAFNLFNHPNFFVQNGGGINATQFNTNGSTCGDGISLTQQCFLTPNPGFKTLQSINQLNGSRVFQFALSYKF